MTSRRSGTRGGGVNPACRLSGARRRRFPCAKGLRRRREQIVARGVARDHQRGTRRHERARMERSQLVGLGGKQRRLGARAEVSVGMHRGRAPARTRARRARARDRATAAVARAASLRTRSMSGSARFGDAHHLGEKRDGRLHEPRRASSATRPSHRVRHRHRDRPPIRAMRIRHFQRGLPSAAFVEKVCRKRGQPGPLWWIGGGPSRHEQHRRHDRHGVMRDGADLETVRRAPAGECAGNRKGRSAPGSAARMRSTRVTKRAPRSRRQARGSARRAARRSAPPAARRRSSGRSAP